MVEQVAAMYLYCAKESGCRLKETKLNTSLWNILLSCGIPLHKTCENPEVHVGLQSNEAFMETMKISIENC